MPFRTVIISTHSKLEYSLNYIVYKTITDVKRINLDEIHTLIIESTAVSMTSALLIELMKRKIKVIFCDEKHNPHSELISYYGDSISSRRLSEQLSWTKEAKGSIWAFVIKAKINNQSYVLQKLSNDNSFLLSSYCESVEFDDATNREGHAAKLYFNRVFGEGFNRSDDNNELNVFLNYGYSLLLSQFNRCIVSSGYLTQLGIHHKNDFNQFNFSCDLMEPFRPLIDLIVLRLNNDNYKEELINYLSSQISIDGKKQTIINAISIYCNSVFNALNHNNPNLIKLFSFNE